MNELPSRPVPPAVAWHWAKAAELAMREGNESGAIAAIKSAFKSAEEIAPVPDHAPVCDVIQSANTIQRLHWNDIYVVGELCNYSFVELQKHCRISAPSARAIVTDLEEVGRKLADAPQQKPAKSGKNASSCKYLEKRYDFARCW